MTKCYVHICKFSCKKTYFTSFRKEIELYIDSLRFSMKQKAIKTLKMYKYLHIVNNTPPSVKVCNIYTNVYVMSMYTQMFVQI